MTLVLVLIPLLAVLAILAGANPRGTARGATGLMLALGLSMAALWALDARGMLATSFTVLSKPQINLALDLYDGMSVIMMLLSVFVAYSAARSGDCEERHEKLWSISVLLIAGGALGAFLATDLFFFYAFHELALIPTFLCIGLMGRGDRKQIAWKVTIYLAFGSIILLAGLLWLVSALGAQTFSFSEILNSEVPIPVEAQRGISALLLIGFGTLVSLFPFHSWAAPAYASAPAPIAMLHAGVLKKFGLYGLLRLYPLVPEGMSHWLHVLIVLLLGNILWVGFVTINQKRLDSLLGNSSVMHMGYIFLAFAALIEAVGEQGDLARSAAVLLMFGHGITIALLFGLADRIERRTGSLDFRDLGGLAKTAPALAFLFGIAAMASIGLPGLANFAGEVMVFIAGFKGWNPEEGLGWVQVATILAIWGVVISAVYMLRAYRIVFQGPTADSSRDAKDLSNSEKSAAALLAVVLLVVGLYPKILLNFLEEPDPSPVVVQEALPPAPLTAASKSPLNQD